MDAKDITEDHTHWLMDRAYAYAEKELYGEYKCADEEEKAIESRAEEIHEELRGEIMKMYWGR